MPGIEDFLASSEGQDTISAPKDTSAFSKWAAGEDENNQLNYVVRNGMERDPNEAQRLLKLQLKTGLPEDLISRNIDTIEKEARANDFDAAKFRENSPIVAQWYAENPNHAAVAYDDIQKMGYLEKQFNYIKDQYAAGNATTELGQIGQDAFWGKVTPEQRKRQSELEKNLSPVKNYGIGEQGGISGFIEGIPAAIANQIPIQVNTFTETAKYTAGAAGAGAALGGGAGLIAGPGGAVAGAIAGAGQGATLGWRVGSGIAAGRLEAGLAYLEFEKMKDENGNTLDRSTAMGAAAITGVINGALESVSFGALTKNVPGLRNLSRPGIKALLANPTTRSAFMNYAKNVGESMLAEGGTEFLQELVKSTAGELATMQQDGSLGRSSAGGILDRLFSQDKVSAAVQSGIAGAQGGGGMSAVLGTTAVAADLQKARNAESNAKAFAEIGKQVKETNLFKNLPEKTQEVIGRLVKDGPAEKVYAPVESWNEYWQTQGVDPRAVAVAVTGNEKAYDEAIATGADIAIPTELYATKLAPTDHNEFFQNELRSNPNEMNAREGREYVKKLDEEDARAQTEATSTEVTPDNQARESIRQNAFEQLRQAGFTDEIANTYAALNAEVFGALAERNSLNAADLYNKYGLQVGRPELQTGTFSEFQTLEQAGYASQSGALMQAQSDKMTNELAANGAPGAVQEVGTNAVNQQNVPVYDQGNFGSPTQVTENTTNTTLDQSTIDQEQFSGTIVEGVVPEVSEIEELRARVQALETELRTSSVTGLRNQRAFDEDASLGWPTVGAMDMDGLKKLNDAIGHEAADKVLRALGGILLKSENENVRFYHRSGDEFAARFKDQAAANQFMSDLQKRLDSVAVELDVNDKTYVYNGIGLSFGVGENYEQADQQAISQKQERLASGQREDARGTGAPRRLSEVTGNQTDGQSGSQNSAAQERVLNQNKNALLLNKERLESEGFSFYVSEDPYFDDAGNEIEGPAFGENGSTFKVYAEDKNGNEVGSASFLVDDDGALVPNDYDGDTEAVVVNKDFRRKGIATELYRLAAESTGKSISNKNSKTNAGEAFRKALREEEPTVFLQSQGEGPLGRIRIAPNRQISIDLLKNANLSTFIHELGHFYLEVVSDLAQSPNANEQIKKDFDTIRKWVGAEEGKPFTTEQHEQFARGFEAYTREGKAPSSALREAFSKFRAWLSSIYKKVTQLNVELNPEVRQVFDRLVATEAQIKAAQEEQQMQPLFTDLRNAGFSEQEAIRYSDNITQARLEAQDLLTKKQVDQERREQQKAWQDERDEVKEVITDEVNQERGYISLDVLQSGKLPDGRDVKEVIPGFESFKLSKQSIINQFGEEMLARLPKPYVYAASGGVDVEIAAGVLGYNSAQEMLNEISTIENKDAKINRLADEEMKSRYGDIFTDGTMPVEAMKSVHNNGRARVLLAELKHLASTEFATFKGLVRRVSRPIPTIDIVRDSAEEIIRTKKVREINPLLYQRAERKSAKEAVDALLRGDIEGSFEAKQRELLNHELYRAATNAREEIDKAVDYARKFDKSSVRSRIGQAGESYLDQIDAITDRFDFTKNASLRSIDRRKSLLSWVQEQQKEGIDIDVPEKLLNEAYKQHYKDLTFDEITGITDTLKNIEHLARLKNKLLANEDARSFADTVNSIVSSITAHHELKDEKWDLNPSFKDKLIQTKDSIIASHTRMEFLFEFLDGNKAQGPVWQALFKPMIDAENAEAQMMNETTTKLREIFGAYTKAERSKWFLDKINIPEAETQKIKNTSFDKSSLFSIALNWGNAYNRDALMRGYGWSEAQVEKILSHLDKRDWDTVQAIWDHINTYWPKVAEMEKKINGVAPDKVEATSFNTKFGEYKGGYYPVIFDPKFSPRQERIESAANVQEMFGGSYAKAMTKKGHTKERTDTGGKPILLDMSGLSNHLAAVIHDLSHRPAVIDVNRLINTKEVRDAITSSAGKEMYRQLNPWLTNIAGDRQVEPTGYWERILSRAKNGATVAGLGLKLTSAIVQVLGYANTVKELGPRYALSGVRETLNGAFNFRKTWNFISERSEMMAQRVGNADRDIREATKKLNLTANRKGYLSVADFYTNDIKDSFFIFTNYMDLATSVPTWIGAYRKAMDGGLENVAKGDEKAAALYADQVVRQTQSAGSAKDLADVQRGSIYKKMFSMFYSSLSLQFNQFFKTSNQYRFDKNVPRLIGSLAMLWFVPAVMEDIIKGRGPDSEDEPEQWVKWMTKKLAFFPFQTVVGIRDIVSAYDTKIETGRKIDFTASPAFGALETVLDGFSSLANPLIGEELTRSDARGLVNAVGVAFALPSRQTWMTLEYMHDWMTGEENPDNPMEAAWRALVIGKEKKK